MAFELWETESRNLAAVYDTEAEALVGVREAVVRHGRKYAESFALVHEDKRGNSRTVAMGAELVSLALPKPAISKAS